MKDGMEGQKGGEKVRDGGEGRAGAGKRNTERSPSFKFATTPLLQMSSYTTR